MHCNTNKYSGASFEAFAEVTFQTEFYWVVTPL